MKKFTLKVVKQGQSDKYVPDATLTQYGLCMVRKIGRGKSWEEVGLFNGEGNSWTVYEKYEDVLFPIFNEAILPKEIKDKISTFKGGCTLQEAIDNNFTPYMLRMGQNEGPNGAYCFNYDQDQADEKALHELKIANKQIPIKCWHGRLGFRFNYLPKTVWEIIRPYGSFMTDNEAEDWVEDCASPLTDDWRDFAGWSYREQALDALWNGGFAVAFDGTVCNNRQEYDEYIARKTKREDAIEELYKKLNAATREAKDILQKCLITSLYASVEQVAHAKTGKTKLYPLAGIEGHNIYGSGDCIMETPEAAYYIRNNGMDGDDWSRNNYDTGGAGAICYVLDADTYTAFKEAYAKALELYQQLNKNQPS